MQNGKDTILLVQAVDAALGTDGFVIGHLTENSYSIENEIVDEQTKFGRIVAYGNNSESFEFTAYGEKGDPGQKAVLDAIKNKKQIKVWEVDLNQNENLMHDAVFAFCVVESVEKSSPGEGFQEVSATVQVIGSSQEGEINPLPPEVIAFAQYAFEAPGESGTEPVPAPTGLSAGTPTATSVSLTWNAVTGTSEYRIYRDNVQVGTSATASFNATGLTAATTYSFQVTAVGTNGVESAKSTAVSVTTSAT